MASQFKNFFGRVLTTPVFFLQLCFVACGGQGRLKGQQETVCDQWGRRRRGSHVPEVDHGHETAGGERDRRAIQRGNVLANGGAYHHRGQEN